VSLSIFLQLFLLIDVFFVGVLTTIAVRHGRAHFGKQSTNPETPASPTDAIRPTELISPRERERLIQESQRHFEETVTSSVAQLQQNLGATASELDQLLRRLGGEIVGNELERYRVEVSQLRQQAQVDLGGIKTEVSSHRAELENQMAAELAAEKQRLLAQIDTKLGDAVSSFLVETLQHNIDLGAQEAYLRELLETHKSDFKNEVSDEPSA